MSWCKIATDYRRICFNEAVVFLNMSTPLHTRAAAGTFLEYGKFSNVTRNGEGFDITRNNSNTSNIQKKKGQRFKTK
jgi:hypothetical protein